MVLIKAVQRDKRAQTAEGARRTSASVHQAMPLVMHCSCMYYEFMFRALFMALHLNGPLLLLLLLLGVMELALLLTEPIDAFCQFSFISGRAPAARAEHLH